MSTGTPTSERRPPARIPSLDGLRALSITAVLGTHLVGTKNYPTSLPGGLNLAELGVRVFFVISGYLISTLLFADQQRITAGRLTRRKALVEFYIRRMYRLFPAAYVFVGVIALLAAAGVVTLRAGDLLAAATYTMNYHVTRSWWVGHLWSLSVEEQFYFLWPAMVFFAGIRRAGWFAAAALLIAPLARIGCWLATPSLRPLVGEIFPTIFDAIAAGCVLASLRTWLGQQPSYLCFLQSPLFWVVPVAIIGANLMGPHPRIDLSVGQSIQNVGIALLIDRSIRFPGGVWGRLLNARPMVFVGVLSYSLYLWQQPLLNRHSDAWVAVFPVNVALAVALAIASYYLVEQPFLRLRARRAAKRPPDETGAVNPTQAG
jgi:peptidoglycan/LPS O-acetylase OafA/YrhL